MHPGNKFWYFVVFSISVTLAVFAGMAVLFWHGLSPQEKHALLVIFRRNLIYLFSVFILMVVGVGFILDGFLNNYILPVNKITDEVILIHSVNPSHRIRIEAGADVTRLAEAINDAASRFAETERQVREKIEKAREEIEEEKNILAAVISELPTAVLICNAEGRILLYNRQAKGFYPERADGDATADDSGRYVGLGRSVFGLFDKNLIVHALDEIRNHMDAGAPGLSSGFVQTGGDGLLILVEVVPILDHLRHLTGFVLIADDITRRMEHDSRTRLLLQTLMRRFRASLAGIRSAVEAIIEFPGMGPSRLKAFHEIIHRECTTLADALNRAADDYARQVRSNWPLVPIHAGDLLDMVRKKAEEKLDIPLAVVGRDEPCWLKADSYSLLMTVLFLLKQIRLATAGQGFACRLSREKSFVHMDLFWEGTPLKPESLRQWEEQMVGIGEEGLPMTCREVLNHHEAEIFSFSEKGSSMPCIRLMFPAEEMGPQRDECRPIFTRSRPEFYDFDLFNQPGQVPEKEQRRLAELSYTVFDTETTGLDPRGGDEIISIGAVRIVNNRMLRKEVFEQLVDPLRPVPRESVRIHGIEAEMLKGKPTIDQVLPLFHRFAEDSVLVAHNAAFDMRMLQLKEASTGIRFIHPVLDTMLLSAVVHPAHESHELEEIACRLGVRVVGRHSALGDALMTAELLLRLIPLLEKRGIHTLGQAIQASRKTYHARLKF